MAKFRKHTDVKWDRKGGGRLEAYSLPDYEKEQLCRDLLAEFGVTHIREGSEGELIHGCVLPFSDHRNQDREPTASLNYLKLTYNCLGSCSAGGGLLWFIGVMRDTSATQARQWLRDKTDIGEGAEGLSSLLTFFDEIYNDRKVNQYAPIPHMSEDVLDPWLKIHPYMTEMRGIPEKTLIKFKIGYAKMRTRVGPNDFIESERIVIPHFWKGDLVGWQTRRIFKDGTPKYKNSPDFPKDQTIYNYDLSAKTAVIVESSLSVLSKDHMPYHIEGTFGGSLTERQKRLIAGHSKVVIFADNDDAGWKMTHELGVDLEAYTPVFVADNPYAADPADLDDETYQRAVEEALPYNVWSQPQELIPWESGNTP